MSKMYKKTRETRLDWTFAGSWPHPPQWFETPEGRMHFVDVGPRDGRPVVLVHGNPTWGYLYRSFIPPLIAAGRRVIVPDHLGFGRSDKPASPRALGVPDQARRLAALLDSLDLKDAAMVVHDWGGPLGLYWATRHPDRVRCLALLNTFAHRPLGRVALSLPLRLFRAPGVGELLVQGAHAITRGFLFAAGVVHRDRLTPAVRAAYLAPHPSWSTRTAILSLARDFPGGPAAPLAAFLEQIHDGLTALVSRPVFIAWAGKDAVFTRAALELWLKDFPRAQVLRLPDAGHFLQEDAPELVVPAFVDFLARDSS